MSFSGAVTVPYTPQLALNSGGIAISTTGSGSNTLTFTYVVRTGENSSHLDESSAAALMPYGGIVDGSGNPASLALPAPGAVGSLASNSSIVIDTTAPTVTSVTSPEPTAPITDDVDDRDRLQRATAFVTGALNLALNSGGTASYTSGYGTSMLTFTYVVGSGQIINHLDEASAAADSRQRRQGRRRRRQAPPS